MFFLSQRFSAALLKFNIAPEKLPGPNRKVVFQIPLFRSFLLLYFKDVIFLQTHGYHVATLSFFSIRTADPRSRIWWEIVSPRSLFCSGRRIDESDAPKGTHTGPKGDIEGYWMKQHLILPHKVSPLPVINGVITPNKWLYKWVTGVLTLLFRGLELPL